MGETMPAESPDSEPHRRLSALDPWSLAWTSALTLGRQLQAAQTWGAGVYRYIGEFSQPFWTALNAFLTLEGDKVRRHSPWESLEDYLELFLFNLQVAQQGLDSSLRQMTGYHAAKHAEVLEAWRRTWAGQAGDSVGDVLTRQARLLDQVVYRYPEAIRRIRPAYGFHFDSGGYRLVDETERFRLYEVLPHGPGVAAPPGRRPVLILPPYVLGANILCFLPGEGKSYVHAFANQGVPTYIRILKDIDTTSAVQTMGGEDDALDTRRFCETLHRRHGRPVTLNGFCQGGFVALLDLLSGELDGLVDALITCVAPMDGTRSQALVEYLRHLPPRFRDLGYALKTLANGHRIVDGKVMSWVYKLKSMEREAPIFSFFRDLELFDRPDGHEVAITPTAAAINHWLIYDRTDLPEGITRLSFESYTKPVSPEGDLPVRLFHRPLNFRRLAEKGLRWLICCAEADDLVDRPAALAPLDFVPAEVALFPKGHGAIATSWSHPDSACALHTRFGQGYRGPVRFHLDLDGEPI